MLTQFEAIKETIVAFTINKIIQGCVGIVDVFKRIDAVGTSIRRGSVDTIFFNPTLDVLSAITRGGWYF